MTVIECFEENSIENIICALFTSPKKLIFFGDAELMNEHSSRYEIFLKDKDISIEYCNVDKNSLQSILSKISQIITENDDCIFDITGGEDLVLLGVGIAFERYKEQKPFKMCRFNLTQKTITDCATGEKKTFDKNIKLSVDELIGLYGGKVVSKAELSPNDLKLEDVNAMWSLNIKSSRDFNRFFTMLREFEKKCNFTNFDINISLDLSYLRRCYVDFDTKFNFFKDYISDIYSTGIIKNLSFSDSFVKYSYKNECIKPLFSKAGNILEYKCFLEAKKLLNYDYFTEVQNSIFIDWDGIVHPQNSPYKDTSNEIDLILMQQTTPIFISCKNGRIEETELYKFSTVSERFGSPLAKKVLIATDLYSREPDRAQALIQRAKDMDITLIAKVSHFNSQDWQNMFMNL